MVQRAAGGLWIASPFSVSEEFGKGMVKTSDENPDERRRSCEPLIWVGFIHICIFFLNS